MVFAIHGAQKVVVILKLEQLEYLLMAAPHQPMEMWVSLAEWQSLFIVLGEGLPLPGLDFFEDFPLLTLALANLELVNTL